MLAAGSLITASGYAVFALSAERPEYWLGFLPGLALTGIGKTGCVAPLTTVVLDAAPCDLGDGSASGMNNAAARHGGLVAVAALGFAFGGTSATDVASVAVVGAYRRVMWTAAAPAVAAALTALAWLGNEPPEHRGAN
jgi:hypothetical protein